MNFKKRLVTLCLVTIAALSLIYTASAKKNTTVSTKSHFLLCDSYEEAGYKYY